MNHISDSTLLLLLIRIRSTCHLRARHSDMFDIKFRQYISIYILNSCHTRKTPSVPCYWHLFFNHKKILLFFLEVNKQYKNTCPIISVELIINFKLLINSKKKKKRFRHAHNYRCSTISPINIVFQKIIKGKKTLKVGHIQ